MPPPDPDPGSTDERPVRGPCPGAPAAGSAASPQAAVTWRGAALTGLQILFWLCGLCFGAPVFYACAAAALPYMYGDEKTGITVMRMDAGMDSGDMILQEAIPIEDSDDEKLKILSEMKKLESDHLLKSGQKQTIYDYEFITNYY